MGQIKPTQSIIQTEKRCFICGCAHEDILSEHHIYANTGRRDISERLGLKVWLCYWCHQPIHDDNQNDLELKQLGQRVYEEKIGTREDFIRDFNKSYL